MQMLEYYLDADDRLLLNPYTPIPDHRIITFEAI
jgi:hypothetical protein